MLILRYIYIRRSVIKQGYLHLFRQYEYFFKKTIDKFVYICYNTDRKRKTTSQTKKITYMGAMYGSSDKRRSAKKKGKKV